MKRKIYIQTPDTIGRKWRFLGILIILVCLGATYFFWNWMEQSNDRFVEDRLDAHATQVVDDFQSRMEVYGDVVYGGRGLFLINPTLSSSEWDTYMVSQNLFNRYPGLNSIAYLHTDTTEGVRTVAIEYITPIAEAQTTGNNLYTRPELATMFDEADIEGVPISSAPFPSVSPDRAGTSDVGVVLAIYGPDYSASMTDEQKRVSVQGYVGVSLHPKTLLEQSLGELTDDERIRLTVRGADGTMIYDSMKMVEGASVTKEVRVNFGGQPWTMQFEASDDYGLTVREVYAPALMLVGGLIFMVLFVAIFFYRTGIRIRRTAHDDKLEDNHQNN
jgi:hypothetical protein